MDTLKFTPILKQKIKKAGFQSIYELITYLPFKLEAILPLNYRGFEDSNTYLYTGKLVDISHRKNRKSFLVLNFIGEINFSGYFFGTSKYIFATLHIGKNYQLLVKKSGNLWTIKRYSEFKGESFEKNNFVLGKAEAKKHFIPVYRKKSGLKNQDFLKIHQKIPSQIYSLDIRGLVPKNNYIHSILDLKNVHHPKSVEIYEKTLKEWIALNTFLKLASFNYNFEKTLSSQKGISSNLDKDYLQKLVLRLEYNLTISQKNTIWNILKQITYRSL
jgi:RecG-like helicase